MEFELRCLAAATKIDYAVLCDYKTKFDMFDKDGSNTITPHDIVELTKHLAVGTDSENGFFSHTQN